MSHNSNKKGEKMYDKSVSAATKSCHSGTLLVFDTEFSEYFGGGTSRGCAKEFGDLVIDLQYGKLPVEYASPLPSITPSATKLSKFFRYTGSRDSEVIELEKKQSEYLIVREKIEFDWPDFGIPTVHPALFLELINAIELGSKAFKEERKRKRIINVFCVGGHGRTGTFLTIAGVVSGGIPRDKDCIKAIRKAYCENAVEDIRQAELISAVLGKEVDFSYPKKYASKALENDLFGPEGVSKLPSTTKETEYKFPAKKGGGTGSVMDDFDSGLEGWTKDNNGAWTYGG